MLPLTCRPTQNTTSDDIPTFLTVPLLPGNVILFLTALQAILQSEKPYRSLHTVDEWSLSSRVTASWVTWQRMSRISQRT
ncbi:hypothetical protein CEXT_637321 [Caerostris extrusa]|uniref:Uncharacterized protein n=1 Tax=Caerostris extrusa TaxID=172846 RepID=A0AAV4MBY9_CAEEX|nr:hypothetical protein CEXT_637321 [Caerostris extrusa]